MEVKEKNNSAKETSRIEAFSDGVFAIAITLLILEIKVPVAKENETLVHSLLQEWTSFLALLIGFFTILICWINHHFMFSMIQKSNSVLMLINGFKLLVVTLTPFATGLLAKNIQTAWGQPAVSIYCFNFALMGTAMMGIWVYSSRAGFTKTDSDGQQKVITRLYILASVLSAVIWVVSYFSVSGCLILSCIMFIIFVFPEKVVAWQVSQNKP